MAALHHVQVNASGTKAKQDVLDLLAMSCRTEQEDAERRRSRIASSLERKNSIVGLQRSDSKNSAMSGDDLRRRTSVSFVMSQFFADELAEAADASEAAQEEGTGTDAEGIDGASRLGEPQEDVTELKPDEWNPDGNLDEAVDVALPTQGNTSLEFNSEQMSRT